MSTKNDDSIDRLLRQVRAEMSAAQDRTFDLDAGLARIERDGAASRQALLRKKAFAEEAERLAQVTVGWEDAAMRLAEIQDLWHTAGVLAPDLEEVLWDRVVEARRAFRRLHKVTFAVDPGRASPPTPAPAASAAEPGVAEAERQLRELLDADQPDRGVWRAAANAMLEYCFSLIAGWLRAGHVPEPNRLTAAEREQVAEGWTSEAVTDVAGDAAERVVSRLRERLSRGPWPLEPGVTLTGDLSGRCAAELPAALRSFAHRHPRLGVAGARTPSSRPPRSNDEAGNPKEARRV